MEQDRSKPFCPLVIGHEMSEALTVSEADLLGMNIGWPCDDCCADVASNNFIRSSLLKLRHHVTTLNFEFPYTEIHGSSFPPRRQLVSSSPISAGFRSSSSMFSILTALFVFSSLVCAWIDSPSSLLASSHHPLSHLVSSLCMLSFVFVHICRTQAVLTTDPQAYAYLCILSSSLISVRCIHTPPRGSQDLN